MSAAATAAGYLYASGRLRGRNGRENDSHDHPHDHHEHHHQPEQKRERKPVKVAVYQREPEQAAAPEASAPKKTPKIQYRTRRWRPE
jgi:hypothetical protein